MEQFVLVPCSVCKKSLITQSVTKQELPKYQLLQNPTYQIDSLKKEINKKLLSKADLKDIICRYMEDNGYKYIHKLSHFVTTINSRTNCSIDSIPKNVKNSDFLSILYSKPPREISKPMFRIGDRVRISKYVLAFRKGYKPQFTQEVFEIVAISSRKSPTYTIKYEQNENNRGTFYQKEMIKVILQGNRLQ